MMTVSDWIRQRALSLELWIIHRTSFLNNIPLLRIFHRNVTADIRVHDSEGNAGLGFSVNFKTPYLHLPIHVQKSQVGDVDAGHKFLPAAFRFYDWHSWAHIEGRVEWHGECRIDIKGEGVSFITGFSYWSLEPPAPQETFGLRLAEGVEGTTKILWDQLIVRVKFAPLYWMIEPKNSSHNVVAIKDTELAMLIVSLSEIGSGNQQVYSKALERLEEWVTLKAQRKGTEQALLHFLISIRDWGPLGMEPLYAGLKEVMERLPLPDKERILFDFYADNWGVRNNRNGRLLTVKILQALSTEKALFTLTAISKYVKNQAVSPEELAVIQAAVDAIGKKLRKL
ncbi:MAG: hypothetical protein KZQ72_06175 [Candidatus Thiodiazotropha sp. (ex Cardiolucina cf. quadrata)]|nr:hypothetical protein [Candidatus Thiodiazotropha sp. (ex Cardiolucina cf. quadrata)]